MLLISLFYLLFLVLIILIIFIVLLYTGYHSRTLAPPLLDTYYGLATEGGSSIAPGSYNDLYLADGAVDYSVVDTGLCGSLDFGASGATYQPFSFRPMRNDSQRNITGNVTLLAAIKGLTSDDVEFRIIDKGDSNKVVADPTSFNINSFENGLTQVRLFFSANNLSGSNYHNFALQGKAISTGVSANHILLNSAYMYYY
jgi:hypothetical protein